MRPPKFEIELKPEEFGVIHCWHGNTFQIRALHDGYVEVTRELVDYKQDKTRGGNMDVGQIAQVCHEVNKAYCEALGDTSQPEWDAAPEWQKQSAIDGVDFHLRNPEAGPENSHEEWLKVKKAEGWKLGEVKDPEKKLHPCMVPFEDLPPTQQTKDFIFRQIVHSLRYLVPTQESGTLGGQ